MNIDIFENIKKLTKSPVDIHYISWKIKIGIKEITPIINRLIKENKINKIQRGNEGYLIWNDNTK